MGVNFVCWKWKRQSGDRASDTQHISEVLDALYEDRSHPSVARFDIEAFERAFRGEARSMGAEDPLISRADFAGNTSNWVFVEAGYDEADRLLPALIRAAEKHGLVVYSDAEERIVAMADALAGLARIEQRDAGIASCEDRFHAIVTQHLAPATAEMGFKPRGSQFVRIDGDRVVAIRPVFQDWNRQMEIDASVGFASVARFLDAHRQFCKADPQNDAVPSLATWNIGKLRPGVRAVFGGGGGLYWKMDTEHALEAVGSHAARTMKELVPILFQRYPDLHSFGKWWEQERSSRIELAGVRWILGDREDAFRILDARLKELNELIRTRHYPPDKGERVDLRFFRQFLESQ